MSIAGVFRLSISIKSVSYMKMLKYRSFVNATNNVNWCYIRFISSAFKSKYSQPDEINILKVLNEGEWQDMSKFVISPLRLQKIILSRKESGYFNNLDEPLRIPGLGIKILEKFYDSIISEPNVENKEQLKKEPRDQTKKMRGQLLVPALTKAKLEELTSIIAFHISPSTVSWVKINKDNYALTDWDVIETTVPEGKRIQLPDVMEMAWTVVSSMPQADCFVVENPPSTLRASGSDPNNPKLISINLQKAQLTSMLYALLNARNQRISDDTNCNDNESNKSPQNVYLLRSALPAKLFGLFIGAEIVSAHNQMKEIFDKSEKRPEKCTSNIYIEKDLIKSFRQQKSTEKEMMSRALLLGITFMNLCIYNNNESIDAINKFRYS